MSALPTAAAVPVPVGLSDERLAARVASDATAFTELHERYEQPLLRYTSSLLRDPHDAADAAQDAWTRAFAALRESPVRVLSVRSWLFTVARNACLDRMRDGKRCSPADIDERVLGASPGPDAVLELRDQAREALSDLAGLSERQRAAVVLRDLNGLEGDELARALRTDARRASWLLTDARRSLAEVRSGRVLSCETARRQLDTKRVRTRAVRAHLAGCEACDGYARRRVASRVHLHGIAVFVLALPARLRALLRSGIDTVKPIGAIAAATLAAGVPAVHELHHHPGAGARHARPAAPHETSVAPAVAIAVQHHARARTVVLPRRARHALAVLRRSAHAPAWQPAGAPASPRPALSGTAAPIVPVAVHVPAPALVRSAVEHVAGAVTSVAPAAAPVVRVVTGTLAPVTG